MATVYDSTAPADIPGAPDGYVFAYNDGAYEQVDAVRARFPTARIITISAIGVASADVVDIENGCVWPIASGVAYVQRERAAGRNPAVYCNRSLWPAVIDAFAAAGMAQPLYGVAHYTNVPHLCDTSCGAGYTWADTRGQTAVFTQYGGDLPGHYDVSITNGTWPDSPLTPAGGGTVIVHPITPTPPAPVTRRNDPMEFTLQNGEDRKLVVPPNSTVRLAFEGDLFDRQAFITNGPDWATQHGLGPEGGGNTVIPANTIATYTLDPNGGVLMVGNNVEPTNAGLLHVLVFDAR
jgi:hypothetical protein